MIVDPDKEKARKDYGDETGGNGKGREEFGAIRRADASQAGKRSRY